MLFQGHVQISNPTYSSQLNVCQTVLSHPSLSFTSSHCSVRLFAFRPIRKQWELISNSFNIYLSHHQTFKTNKRFCAFTMPISICRGTGSLIEKSSQVPTQELEIKVRHLFIPHIRTYRLSNRQLRKGRRRGRKFSEYI